MLHPDTSKSLMLAGKSLGLAVGVLTLVATEVGGAFVNGTAEIVFTDGFLFALAPIGYSLSMTVNGLFFVQKLRDADCVTCVDVLQSAYGATVGGLIYLPSCVGDVCWNAAVLSALGGTLAVILDAEEHRNACVAASALVAVGYTLVGGMYSVAYTDVVQLLFVFVGLWIAVPFVLASERTDVRSLSLADWAGRLDESNWIGWADSLILILCGGIPWQPYYQRALSVRSGKDAKILSVAATAICILCMIPPVLIGGAAKTATSSLNLTEDTSLVLPVLIRNLVPNWASVVALAAISAAAMSSVDSSLLSGASYLTHNIFTGIVGKKTAALQSENARIFAFRLFVVLLGVCSVALSLSASTVYGLWVLAGDLGFVIVFPQFLMAVHWPHRVNAVGSVAAAVAGTTLRILIGEPLMSIGAVIATTRDGAQVFPVKTALMLITLTVLIAASKASKVFGRARGSFALQP